MAGYNERSNTKNYAELLEKERNKRATAELDYYNQVNEARLNFETQLFNKQKALHEKQARIIAQTNLIASEQELKDRLAIATKEYKERLKLEKDLTKKQRAEKLKQFKEELKERGKAEIAAAKEIAEKVSKMDAIINGPEKSEFQNDYSAMVNKTSSLIQNKQYGAALKTLKATFAVDKRAGFDALANAVSDIAKELNQTIDNIGARKGIIDTRLQGSKNWRNTTLSYWDTMSSRITGIAGVSPYIKQEDLANNVQAMVTSGIAFNVEQRAFLQTIKSKIADTFDATNGTLLRLIRIQQADSTAARLGMESSLTAFLNNMYENTEYLKQVSDGVKASLEEAMSLMSAVDAVGFEYSVQKWMGSLYSVGMSQNAVQGIAGALGQLSAGDISGLNGTGYGNLLVMAANNAGLSLADILQKGLDESSTNTLMQAMVSYLSTIANETASSRVVQQQLAKVYGLSAADLKAATNLKGSFGAISSSSSNYNQSLLRLYAMTGTMGARTGAGELLSNLQNNLQYTMAAGIANNPALYAIYKVAGIMDMFGGVQLPALSVMGNMVDLETNVADLMRVAALSGGLLSSIGSLMSGGGGALPLASLASLGILPGVVSTVSRGRGGFGFTASGVTLSNSGFAGNADAGDVKEKTINDANDDANRQMIDKQEEQETDVKNKVINENVVKIYELLLNVTNGSAAFKVNMGDNSSWTRLLTGGFMD